MDDEAGRFRSDIEIGETDVPENVRLVIRRRPEGLDDVSVDVILTRDHQGNLTKACVMSS